MTWGDDTTADHMLRDISDVMAMVRRAGMRVVGTPDQETLRAIGQALARGAGMRVERYLAPNTIVLIDGTVLFSSQDLMDRFLAGWRAVRPVAVAESLAAPLAKVLPFRPPTAAAPSGDCPP